MIDAGGRERCLRKREVAEWLGCSERQVERWIAAGELMSVKLGRLRRVLESSVRVFIARREAKGEQPWQA